MKGFLHLPFPVSVRNLTQGGFLISSWTGRLCRLRDFDFLCLQKSQTLNIFFAKMQFCDPLPLPFSAEKHPNLVVII